jgi:hypothetical protein
MANFYALLIGINHYLPNKLPSGLYYKSLRGCVQDIVRVEKFLREHFKVPAENILKLTSTAGPDQEPLEPSDQLPSYRNIVDGFFNIGQRAEPGDQVYIHYSGHGGRAGTTEAFYEVKGRDGVDEVLVPVDLGGSEGNYLRDTELHYLLRRLVDKGLLVTVVLDSCHAGGATRRAEVGIRGMGEVDRTPRLSLSRVAPGEELVRAWRGSPAATRKAQVGSGWLLEPEGYVLLAACRANEYANEVVFEGSEVNGALSYWLVDSLRRIGPRFTYKLLHDRILAKVRNQFVDQTPQLQGEGDRVVFGAERVPVAFAVPILSVNGDSVVINAGRAHGLSAGARLAVFRAGESDRASAAHRVAVIETTTCDAVTSSAAIVERTATDKIEPGFQALPITSGPIRVARRIRLETTDTNDGATTVEEICDLINGRADGLIDLAGAALGADYLITTDGDEFVIRDPAGVALPNMRPWLSINDRESPARLIERLVHLSKFANVRELENHDPHSPLLTALQVELTGVQSQFVPGDKPAPQPFESDGHTHRMKDGEWTFLKIVNQYSKVVNITVLDLQPDWGISQIYPARGGAFETLDPGKGLLLPLKVTLPPGYESGNDIIKVFGAIETSSFRWLELPVLDQPESGNGARRAAANSFAKMISTFPAANSSSRTVTVPETRESEWVTHQVEIQVVKAAQTGTA